MEHLVRGIHYFQALHFGEHGELFRRLVQGHAPRTLIITCADARVAPELVLQTRPGERVVLRNEGNLVPPWGHAGGEAATIEHAIGGLGVEDIVVLGHTHCLAMAALLGDDVTLTALPSLREWLRHAAPVRRIVAECHADLGSAAALDTAVRQNVLVQVGHLHTHPLVAERLAEGRLRVHAWVYDLERGNVLAFDPLRAAYVAVTECLDLPVASGAGSSACCAHS